MIFKVKYMLFGKIAILLCLCLVLNNTFMFKSYADESIAAQNPLFIPINTFVTAALIGSGMIAKNSQQALDAGGQLVNNIIAQIKSSEVAKSEANPDYDSPFRVINGGKSEKPNNENKNGKWFAAAAGALATHDIWANKDAIKDIMSKANSLGGYETSFTQTGIKNISDTNLLSTANASGVSLQLAQIDNRLNTQFTEVIKSNVFNTWVTNNHIDKDNLVYAVCVYLPELAYKSTIYPKMTVSCVDSSEISKIGLDYSLSFNTITSKENSYNYAYSYSYYYLVDSNVFKLLNSDGVSVTLPLGNFTISARNASTSPSVSSQSTNSSIFSALKVYSIPSDNAYFGFKWTTQNPIQFTNNVYNVNMSFDENFQNWLQGQIQGLGDQIIDAVRLGITSVNPSWEPAQEQIQAGTSPSNVIYQFINNYENPENIPDDETQPDPDPDPEPSPGPAPEPVPDNEYLGNFLLPESITTKFPFCIPFDVVRCLRLFSTSDREAPQWETDIGYGDSSYHVSIDLSMFDDIASFIRPIEYLVFLVGLAIGTRSLIRG